MARNVTTTKTDNVTRLPADERARSGPVYRPDTDTYVSEDHVVVVADTLFALF